MSGNSRIPKVSIGVPVYNGGPFIHQALDSLLAQTFTDFELIISDNASTDETEKICKQYEKKDIRIRYVRQSQNRGALWNFNFVLQEAQGEYFMWAAADDLWLPTFVSECYIVLENDASIGFVVTKYTVTSRFSPLFDRWCVPDLECVTDPDRMRRVLRYSSMPFNTHKDNLVYGLWRRETIAGIWAELRQSPLNKNLIGAMNEYALSLYRGGLVKKALFQKRYRFVPPGHMLGPISGFASRIIHLRAFRKRGNGNSYATEQRLNDVRIVLQLAGFDENYISRVIDANKCHVKFRKVLR